MSSITSPLKKIPGGEKNRSIRLFSERGFVKMIILVERLPEFLDIFSGGHAKKFGEVLPEMGFVGDADLERNPPDIIVGIDKKFSRLAKPDKTYKTIH